MSDSRDSDPRMPALRPVDTGTFRALSDRVDGISNDVRELRTSVESKLDTVLERVTEVREAYGVTQTLQTAHQREDDRSFQRADEWQRQHSADDHREHAEWKDALKELTKKHDTHVETTSKLAGRVYWIVGIGTGVSVTIVAAWEIAKALRGH